MYSVVTRNGFEKAILANVPRAKQWAFRYFQRTGKPVRVVNLTTGDIIAEFGA